MRQILFKAKRLDNNQWAKGSLVKSPLGTQIVWWEDSIEYAPYVDPSTVCQFTGLKDKNGKEIWEHDIVKYCTEREVVLGRAGICLRADNGHVMFLSSTRIEGGKLAIWSNLGSKFDRKEEK